MEIKDNDQRKKEATAKKLLDSILKNVEGKNEVNFSINRQENEDGTVDVVIYGKNQSNAVIEEFISFLLGMKFGERV